MQLATAVVVYLMNINYSWLRSYVYACMQLAVNFKSDHHLYYEY